MNLWQILGLPELEIKGEGEVTPPVVNCQASYDFHYQEFLSRGLSAEESHRLACEVVNRDALPQE